MGLLKHGILPYFAVFHFFTVICMLPRYRQEFVVHAYYYGGTLSFVEHHLLDAAGGFHAAMCYGCFVGSVWETSHFRSRIIIMEVILWFWDWYGSLQIDEMKESNNVLMINLSIAVIGTFIHYLEPGIFSKDKRQKQH